MARPILDNFLQRHSFWGLVLIYITSFFYFFPSIDIHPDVADFWVWSRYPSYWYYENPPMVAWAMALLNAVIADPKLCLMTGSILVCILIYLCGFLTATSVLNKEERNIYVILLMATPYLFFLGFYWATNGMLAIFWMLSLWAMLQFLQTKKDYWLLVLGAFIGFGFLSKYIMVLFGAALGLWIILFKENRYLLKKKELWLSGLIALIICSPLLYHEYNKGWLSFQFIMKKGFAGSLSLKKPLDFTLGHIALFSLFLSIPAWKFFIKKKLFACFETSIARFLLVHSLVPILFFSLSAFRGRTADPNWAAAGYFSLFLLLARCFFQSLKDRKRSIILLISLSFIFNYLVAFAMSTIISSGMQISKKIDKRINESDGWEETAFEIEKLLKDKGLPKPSFVIAREYQLGGALSLYLQNHPLPFSIERPQRNIWINRKKLLASSTIMVCRKKNCAEMEYDTRWEFKKNLSKLGDVIIMNKMRKVRHLEVWKLEKTK